MSKTYEHKICENCEDSGRIDREPRSSEHWEDAWEPCDECETCHHCRENLFEVPESEVLWDSDEEMWACSQECLAEAHVEREKFFSLHRAAALTRKINQTLLVSKNV